MRVPSFARLAAAVAPFTLLALPTPALAQQTAQVLIAPPPAPPSPGYVEAPRPSIVVAPSEGSSTAPGYHESKHVRTGLIITGASLFVGAYAVAVLGGIVSEASQDGCFGPPNPSDGCYLVQKDLFIPVVGPIIDLGRSGGSSGGYIFDAIDGAVQVGALTMVALAIAMPKTVLVRDDAASNRGFHLALVPVLAPGRTGMGLMGTF